MKTRRIAVLVLSLAMVLTMSVSVFAAPANDGDAAKLVKYLKVAEGVTKPDASFEFTFTPVEAAASEVNGVSNTYANSVATDTETFSFTKDDLTACDGGYKAEASVSDIFANYTFPHAGVYAFTVAEKKGAATIDGGTMEYDSSTFTLRFSVDNDGNIDNVTVSDEDGKVDPTDTDPTDAEDPQGDDATKGFTFINNFVKMVNTHEEPNPDPEDPENPTVTKDGAFKLSKVVTGQFGNKTKDFNFVVDVEIPENTPSSYSLDENTPGDMAIHDGESLVYNVLPVGTKITVTEKEANQGGYTTSFDKATTFTLGENGEFITCTNAFDDNSVTPTGIIINNLPYVLMIVIAVGGIVLFTRKRRCE